MALICKDNWDLLCSIKKHHNQFSYSAAQQALQILILQCRIYFFFKGLLQACVLGLHFYSFSFSEEFSALRSWHPFDAWQQAIQPVWRLQCCVELSARPEQTCCGTEGCPSPATWSWDRLLSLAASQHTVVHPAGQVLSWYNRQHFTDPRRYEALHLLQMVPASSLSLLLLLYLTNLSIPPQLLLLGRILPLHWEWGMGCLPQSASDANPSQHWAGPWPLTHSEQKTSGSPWKAGDHALLCIIQSSGTPKQVERLGYGPERCPVKLVLDVTAEREERQQETVGGTCISISQLSTKTSGAHCQR